MQISTRTRDYIVDALALRPYIGAALARPFADAAILKVLHGADSDVHWLQKDFGLFLVSMFDTGQAAQLLHLPRGLGALLLEICGVKVRGRCRLHGARVPADAWCLCTIHSAQMHGASVPITARRCMVLVYQSQRVCDLRTSAHYPRPASFEMQPVANPSSGICGAPAVVWTSSCSDLCTLCGARPRSFHFREPT
jgi:hypothetical protein